MMMQSLRALALLGVVLVAAPEHVRAYNDDAKAEVLPLLHRAESLKKAGKLKESVKLYKTVLEKA